MYMYIYIICLLESLKFMTVYMFQVASKYKMAPELPGSQGFQFLQCPRAQGSYKVSAARARRTEF